MVKHIDMIRVESSTVAEVGYDAAAAELRVRFSSGGLWAYRGVPPHVYGELVVAESKGSFLHQNVKGQFPEEQLDDGVNTYATVVHSRVLCPGCSAPMAHGVTELTVICQKPMCRLFNKKFKAPCLAYELEAAS